MPSPTRRSTRSALPPTQKSQSQTGSSSSSVVSSRPERSTRAAKASPSPQEDTLSANQDPEEEEGSGEVTRCICGKQDYPGAPIPLQNNPAGDGDLFIQCDKCSVWQHGGCVGIMDQNKTPDEYFCEQCDKKLHQLHTDERGQRYSLFLPFHPQAQSSVRKTSMSRDNEVKIKRDREALARLGADINSHKRRSTTNSRHTYDEEEMLRKAIEESKRDQDVTRKGKRGRDESDDTKIDIKRRRTGSESVDAGSTLQTGSLDADSDDDAPTSKSAIKRARAAAAESQRQREMREQNRMREHQREQAADRRKERAGRRRGEDGELEEKATPTLKADSIAPSSRPASPPEIEITQPSSSHKKSAGKKGKRLGRNQYTKDRDQSPPRNKTASSSSGEEPGKQNEPSASTKQSPSSASADNAHPSLTNTSHKGKGKQKGKNATTNGTASHDRDKNGRSKFTSWDDYNAELTFVEDHIREVISYYEARAARPSFPSSSSSNSSGRLADGQSLLRKATPLSANGSSGSSGDVGAGPTSHPPDEITPRNARDLMTPLADYGSMPTLEHAQAMLRDLQIARQAFKLRRPEGPPRTEAVRQAARDLGV